MKRLNEIVAVSVVALSLVSLPVQADHPVEITMLVESFDGCGCQAPFDDPISCAPCPEGVVNGYPDCDLYGDRSLDHHWKNTGWPADYAGDSTEPAQGFGAQTFSLGDIAGDRSITPACGVFNGAIAWIDFDNVASPSCGTTGGTRFDCEAGRSAQLLPPAYWDQPGYFLIAVRRDDVQGDGETSDITTKVLISLSGLYGLDADGREVLIPNSTATALSVDVLPGAGWTDVRVTNVSRYIKKGKIAVMVFLGPDGNSVDCTKGERVTFKLDNIRYVYTGKVADSETDCANGVDDDMDGLTDCADVADCNGNAACPCNQVVIFDTDFDGDVDQVDFAFFQACVTGPGPNSPLFDALSGACKCLDRAGSGGQADQAIDQSDLLAFESCASGPGITADTGCDD